MMTVYEHQYSLKINVFRIHSTGMSFLSVINTNPSILFPPNETSDTQTVQYMHHI